MRSILHWAGRRLQQETDGWSAALDPWYLREVIGAEWVLSCRCGCEQRQAHAWF